MKKALPLTFFVLGLCFLAFILGMWIAQKNYYPYRLWVDATYGVDAMEVIVQDHVNPIVHKEMYRKFRNRWIKNRFDKSGVVLYDQEKAYSGLTLYCSNESRAFLIDMNGTVVHQWQLPFEEVWPEPEHITVHKQGGTYWTKALLYPNGDLLAVYHGVYQSPYGGGLVKLDKNSQLIWKVSLNTHHDFNVAPNGNIYTLTMKYVPGSPPFIEEGFAIISPDGEILEQHSLHKIIAESEYADAYLTNGKNKKDPLHANNIELLPKSLAGQFPQFKVNDILLSFRSPDAIMVLDGVTLEPKWQVQGLTKRQHDPDFLKNGNILVFDNYYKPRGEQKLLSRILEFDPQSQKVVWQYVNTGKRLFFSSVRGSQQSLPNGNVLITESMAGRILEVTREHKTVWEYVNTKVDGSSIGIIAWAERWKKEDLTFLD